MLSQGYLKNLLNYDPDTGIWTWINPPNHNTRLMGKRAGNRRCDGYLKIRIDGVAYYAGRLAYLYMQGRMPLFEVDHIDRDPSNDKWDNLREATSSENKCNRIVSNRSGYRGVDWYEPLQKWRARLNDIHLGYHSDLQDAITARDTAAKIAYGDFAVLNSSQGELT